MHPLTAARAAGRWGGAAGNSAFVFAYDRVCVCLRSHLRQTIQEYVEHYHGERPHQSLGNKLVTATHDTAALGGRVLRRPRLGGVLNFYHREAA